MLLSCLRAFQTCFQSSQGPDSRGRPPHRLEAPVPWQKPSGPSSGLPSSLLCLLREACLQRTRRPLLTLLLVLAIFSPLCCQSLSLSLSISISPHALSLCCRGCLPSPLHRMPSLYMCVTPVAVPPSCIVLVESLNRLEFCIFALHSSYAFSSVCVGAIVSLSFSPLRVCLLLRSLAVSHSSLHKRWRYIMMLLPFPCIAHPKFSPFKSITCEAGRQHDREIACLTSRGCCSPT